MAYNITAIRSAENDGDPRLYPELSEANSSFLTDIEPEDGDPSTIICLRSDTLTISELQNGKLVTVGRLHEVPIDIYITDGRVIIASDKYTKGGGWRGFSVSGLAVAAVANTVSHARAAHKRKGTVLVGHVRYPWLSQVGGVSRSGMGTHNGIRLTVTDNTNGTKRKLFVSITLDKRADPPNLAAEIARRAARFRLARDITPDNEHRAGFESVANATPLAPEPKAYVFHAMPQYYFVKESTAYLKKADQAAPPAPIPSNPSV